MDNIGQFSHSPVAGDTCSDEVHVLHAMEPDEEYFPLAHTEHDATLVDEIYGLNVPLGHMMYSACPARSV